MVVPSTLRREQRGLWENLYGGGMMHCLSTRAAVGERAVAGELTGQCSEGRAERLRCATTQGE